MEGILLNQTGKYATKDYVQSVAEETINNQNIPINLPIRTFTHTSLDEGYYLSLSTEQKNAGRITPRSYITCDQREYVFNVPPLIIECTKPGLYNCCIDIESGSNRLPGYGTLSVSIDNFYTFPDMGPNKFSSWGFPGESYTGNYSGTGKYPWFIIYNGNFTGNYSGMQFVKYFKKGETITFKLKAGTFTNNYGKVFEWGNNQMTSGSYSGSKSHDFYIDFAVYAFCCSKEGLKAEGKKDCFRIL